jgi:hypothetical protein
MIPVSDRFVGSVNERFNSTVSETSMVQKRCEGMSLSRRVPERKYFLLASLLNHAVEHCSSHQLIFVRPLPSREG